ncbi:Outer membrane protein assembly factor BamB, contains PQQ-like beta-propeller repeat [Neorhodopirellula lusitana]|uniref:Outer membrane protein assembly factor BamB, contains PQQ-like beta-propeller repeat n=1 Tax=Neorhodopirellula lusitana TaxID=445327 RepID=A0ABY1PX17_9BACT|nr:PQQ-binding-like beta-propeller repeat protein [Neorhodopirellula lusitana]SMP51735.1 Outer membrane protein assembly factor BamB, contains PQQ-like beta-propeller repeat [Neorhodopirellula lusitana]
MPLPTSIGFRSFLFFAWIAVGSIPLASAQDSTTASADWTYWRGPNFNGHAQADHLVDNWDAAGGAGSNVLWKRDDLGARSTPVVMNGRLYVTTRADAGTPTEGEKVICLDAKTGETLWENRFNVWMSDVPDTRVGWASVVADPESGNIYALGVCDLFLCINGKTGQTIWSKPLHEQFGFLSTYGGRTNFPVVHEDLVIISAIAINWGNAAKPNHRLLAMDKLTGEVVWFSGTKDLPDDTTYSAPTLATIDGQRQLILGTGDGAVWGVQPRTGKTLWNYDISRRGLFATPLVDGNRVYCSHSEENVTGSAMGAVAALEVSGTGDDTKVKELWKLDELVVGRSAPIVVDGRLYIVDDRCKLWVMDAETGDMIVERFAIGDRKQWPSLLYADEKIYVLTENGRWSILEITEDGVEAINKGRIRNEAFYASPILAGGRLYFQGTSALYCVGTDEATQTPVSLAEQLVGETPVSENPEPAQLLIVPGELLVQPGESVELAIRLFNRLGQSLPTPSSSDVKFTVDGPGSIQGTTFTADSGADHQAVTITAQVGDVVGITRGRIVPPLPWKFTFDDLKDPPVSWVGARYRHQIRMVDGSPALVKVSTIPKGARSRAWMGPSTLENYTISADVRGNRSNGQMPDIGLTAHGYVLDLMGNSQQLQIRTWSPQLRMAQTVDFPWEPDTWYRMKLKARVEGTGDDAVAVLEGKVWPRDQAEPSEWTVTARDASPVMTASPGLFGNAKVAEFAVDNLEVTANE